MNRASITKLLCVIIIFLIPIQKLFALEKKEKLWVAAGLEKPLSEDKKWLYLLYTQMRFINKSHPWQTAILEGAIGYSLYSNEKIWLGYRWSGTNPNNGFYQTNRIFQQLVWTMREDGNNIISSRTRLEESERGNQNQLSYRLRQRVTFEHSSYYFGKLNPLFYDEVFFQLNKTSYTSHDFISQNRLFLGFILYTSSKTFWEIGYINQYKLSTPSNPNQMNHIISITYNLT